MRGTDLLDDAATEVHPVTGLPGRPPTLGARAAMTCARQVWLDHDSCCYSRSERAVMSAGQQSGVGESIGFEDRALAALRAALGSRLVGVGWHGGRHAERDDLCDLTSAALAAGAEVVWRPALRDDTAGCRSGAPHLLVRHGLRADGTWSYLPVDVRNHAALEGKGGARSWQVGALARPALLDAVDTVLGPGRPRAKDDVRLAHAVRMLQALGHGPDGDGWAWAGVLDTSLAIVWRDLAPPGQARTRLGAYDEAFTARLRVAHAARRHAPGLPEAEPYCRTFSACSTSSPWRVQERLDLERLDAVVLLHGITAKDAEEYASHGVTSRSALAGLSDEDVVSLGSRPGLAKVADHALTARAWQRGEVLARSTYLGVERADVEIDVDMENSGAKTVYLWGLEVTSRTDPDLETLTSAWADTVDDEAGTFAHFWQTLSGTLAAARERGRTVRVYCYSTAEASTMTTLAVRHAGRPGVPTPDDVRALVTSDVWCDLLKVTQCLAWPTDGLSVKALAPVIGFTWADGDPSGGSSMLWRAEYEAALAEGAADEAARHRSRIVAYNRDDLRVMRALRDWLDERRRT